MKWIWKLLKLPLTCGWRKMKRKEKKRCGCDNTQLPEQWNKGYIVRGVYPMLAAVVPSDRSSIYDIVWTKMARLLVCVEVVTIRGVIKANSGLCTSSYHLFVGCGVFRRIWSFPSQCMVICSTNVLHIDMIISNILKI